MTRGPGVPTALLLAALLPAACTWPAEGSRHLAAELPRWAVAGVDLEFDVRLLGPIALRETGVVVFLDGNRIDLFPSHENVVRVTIPGAALRPGTSTLRLKTGSERAQAEVRVVSRSAAGAAALASILFLVGIFLGLRRRRG